MVEWGHLQVKGLPLLLIQLVQWKGDSREESRGRYLREELPPKMRILPDVTGSSGLLEVLEVISASDPEVARGEVKEKGV